MATFTKGQTVKVKSVVPQGPVVGMRMDDDGNVFCLLRWTDSAGQEQERWFAESELEAV